MVRRGDERDAQYVKEVKSSPSDRTSGTTAMGETPQRGRWHDGVPARGEEIEEGLADLGGGHETGGADPAQSWARMASVIARVPTEAPPKAMSAVRVPPVTARFTAASIRAAVFSRPKL